jgi:predicted ArsR family transcriptional regulator
MDTFGRPLSTPGGTRERIFELLRRGPLTANEIAETIGITHNAVRTHVAALLREGLIREESVRQKTGRPAVVYGLVPRADSVASRAYVPFVAHLLRTLGERMPERELDALMHDVGRSLASQWAPFRGTLRERVDATTTLLEELGALAYVETEQRAPVIRSHGCLLAEAVHGTPEVCRVLESLVSELVRAPVEQCCEHGEHPRCCFKVRPARG